jgi:hypothetical protein
MTDVSAYPGRPLTPHLVFLDVTLTLEWHEPFAIRIGMEYLFGAVRNGSSRAISSSQLTGTVSMERRRGGSDVGRHWFCVCLYRNQHNQACHTQHLLIAFQLASGSIVCFALI